MVSHSAANVHVYQSPCPLLLHQVGTNFNFPCWLWGFDHNLEKFQSPKP